MDPLAQQVMYPIAQRLLAHCDAVLRLPGASTGADLDVAIARERRLPVWHRIEDVPGTGRPARSASPVRSDMRPATAVGRRVNLLGRPRWRTAAGLFDAQPQELGTACLSPDVRASTHPTGAGIAVVRRGR